MTIPKLEQLSKPTTAPERRHERRYCLSEAKRMIRAALELAERGMAVFPCQPRDKRPATANGLKDATTDPAQIERWWQEKPEFNIAIATGARSSIFVVDIDGLDAEGELKKLEARHDVLPSTVEAITGRGRHIYFRWPDMPVRNSASKIAPRIDVRGEGGYVLAPPSIHPTGRAYHWSVDSHTAFAKAPAWLLSKLITPITTGKGATPPSEWRELVNGVAEGVRNCSVAKLAGHLLRRRIDPVMALELMQSWNATRCSPPLPAEEIERIVDSIAGAELRRRSGHAK